MLKPGLNITSLFYLLKRLGYLIRKYGHNNQYTIRWLLQNISWLSTFLFVLPSLKISVRNLLINKSLSFPIEISIKDPNTLNLDPDPEFWPNLYPDPSPDPDPGLWYKFWNYIGKLCILLPTKVFERGWQRRLTQRRPSN